MAIDNQFRFLGKAKSLTPQEIELINKNFWLCQYLFEQIGAISPVTPGVTPPSGGGGVSSHHDLTDLATFDDHPQYLYLPGRDNQTVLGTVAGPSLIVKGFAGQDGIRPVSYTHLTLP